MNKEVYENTIRIQFQMINELTEKIDEAIDYIDHELNYHILQNDEKSWNLQYYTNGKLDYRKLLIALLKDILEILGDKENETN